MSAPQTGARPLSLAAALSIASALPLAVLPAPAAAQAADNYPNRPVRIIAPFAPGGLVDVLARLTGERLAASMGQPFVVDNRPGAGGNIGASIAAQAQPDGYTLLMTSAGILTINPFLYEKMPFDAATAFAPISLVADMPMMLVIGKHVPAQGLKEFIALAKRDPSKMSFGSPGSGTTGHLGMELFANAAGLTITHVPYKSAAEAVNGVIGGQLTGVVDNPPTVLAQIRAGNLRALAVASRQRLPQLPDVPTFNEAGMSGFEVSSWFGMVAPARTPPAIVQRLSAEIGRALDNPDLQAKLSASGARTVASKPEDFAAFIRAETQRWGQIVRSAGIRL
ncbi:MAG: Bug family tripartite tricarboxylate transporter substrate binding protein [bacterium]|jgi:tripartite-type tricarboxylate transporter receptor subunit TctC|nr:tripartite tricarboxylate transporter substrate binding protein [Betaproteobacteria bacterium]